MARVYVKAMQTIVRNNLENIRVEDIRALVPPGSLKDKRSVSEYAKSVIENGRSTMSRILSGEDSRLLVVVGPCSIHDPEAALDYARRLKVLSDKVSDKYFVMMRVYFEKPRTTIGWKGLINDPDMDESCRIEKGLEIARKLLIDVAEIGLPTATEFLDPVTPQFIADLISWAAIGARTTESQTHREMSSGLSMAVGFKNGTDGLVQTAVDAMSAARIPHSFLGIDRRGMTSIIKTRGNKECHLVMRGGRNGPNYDEEAITNASASLAKAGLPEKIMVDCSHANSGKKPENQPRVWQSILEQRSNNSQSPIFGAMLESFIEEGKQSIPDDLSQLKYGQSVTDGCMSWEQTEKLLLG